MARAAQRQKAVRLALPARLTPIIVRAIVQDVPITDLKTSTLALLIFGTGIIKTIKVTLDIGYTYIGDLVVSVKPPADISASPIILHNREGGSVGNLKARPTAKSTRPA